LAPPLPASAQSGALNVPTRIIAQRGEDGGSAIVSANGNVLVTLGGDSPTAKVWDARTGRLARILFTLPDAARNHAEFTALSSDGRRLFGIQNGTGKIWDNETGRTVISFDVGDEAPDGRTAMSIDGFRAASIAKGNKSLLIWDAQSGKQVSSIRTGFDLQAIALSPDGTKVAAAGADKSIRVWDVASAQLVKTLSGHKDAITSIAFSPRGNRLLSQGEQEIRLWSFDGRMLRPAPSDKIDHVYFSADGAKFVYSIGSSGQKIVVWDAEAGTQLAEYALGDKDDSLAGLAEDGRSVWITNEKWKRAVVLDTVSGKPIGPGPMPGAIAGSSSNGRYFLIDKSGTWDLMKSDPRSVVPQISYEAFKHWQYSQARFSGSNFPIARRTAVLGGPPAEQPAGTSSSIPIKPTHVVIAAVTLRQQPDATSAASIQLSAGAQVAIVRRQGGWVVIARDGKQLGYVEEKAVATLQ
jgi:WD40 repeat protein